MAITYDIMVESPTGPPDFVESFISPRTKALKMLAEKRKRFPKAYLVKCIRVRVREARPKKGR